MYITVLKILIGWLLISRKERHTNGHFFQSHKRCFFSMDKMKIITANNQKKKKKKQKQKKNLTEIDKKSK